MNAMTLSLALLLVAPPAAEAPATDRRVMEQLTPLFEALDEVESPIRDRIVRIAWWGDSAIVSDGYTGHLRARLQERFGDAGPGFILAATTFDGYLRRDVRLRRHDWTAHNVIQGALRTGRFGYGGIQATSRGGASSTFESQGAPFTAVEVYHRAFPRAGGIQLFADGAGQPTAEHQTDAETAEDAVWRWVPPTGGVTSVRVRAAGRGETVIYGVALERGDNGVTVDALGLLGMRARRWLNADAEHIEGQVAARRPDLIVLAFGGNERVDPGLTAARHEEDITATLAHLRGGAPDAACLVMGPIAHGVRDRGRIALDPKLGPIYEGQRAAAEGAGCAFFDTVEAMGGGDESIRTFRQRQLIAGDLAHLNSRGHAAVGDLVADWLLAHYDAWRSERSASAVD